MSSSSSKDVGSAADVEWLTRVQAAYDALDHGARREVAKRLGLTNDRLSKLVRRGSGGAGEVMAVSRILGVTPPRRLLDEAQYELLGELERYRAEVERRFGKDAVPAEMEALIRRVRRSVEELLGHK